MNERLISSAFPFVPLVVRIMTGSREYELRIDAMIDTGFDGELILPAQMQREFGQAKSDAIWYLADGTPVEVPSYDGSVRLDGLSGQHLITVSCLGPSALVGIALLRNYRVTLDHGREVIVEP